MSKKSIFYIHKLNFEFDPIKSQFNKTKHGIDFTEAQEIWEDENLILIRARCTDELRYLVIGKLNNKHWSAIITHRRNKIRIISVRRSRQSEVTLYES
jgi:uncharacterized DUF497 family protein